MKPILASPPNTRMTFRIKDGATFLDAADIMKQELGHANFTCAYTFAGICSITKKNKGNIYLPFESVEDIVETTTQNIKKMLKELDSLFTTPIVQCSFPGVDLAKAYNMKDTGLHPLQEDLNTAMIQINNFIIDLNLTRGYSTPMIAPTIHKCHGRRKDGTKKYRHHLHKLDDGVHPTKVLSKTWCQILEENFSQFIFDLEHL